MSIFLLSIACGDPVPPPPPVAATTTFEGEAPAEAAAAEIEASCAAGEVDACWAVGNLQQGKSEYDAAQATWGLNCDHGHGASCADLANLLSNPYVERGEEAEAPRRARMACDLDNAFGCYLIGGWTRDGAMGLTADPVAAQALFERGCTLGHHWACEALERR